MLFPVTLSAINEQKSPYNHLFKTTPMKPFFALSLLIAGIISNVSGQISCTNWLKVPANQDGVNIGDLDVSGKAITVEGVFNRTEAYTPIVQAIDIVSKHDNPNDVNYLLRADGASITTSNGFFFTPPVCEIDINKTYHVAMVYDGILLKFYRNGFLLSQVAATGSLILNNYSTRIGNKAGYYPANEVARGLINEVRIWNTVRTSEQIRAFMNISLPSPAGQLGLLAYYTFDNLFNKQGSHIWDGILLGQASIGNTNTSCTLSKDSCNLPAFCDSWLNVPAGQDGFVIGDLDVTGQNITVEGMFNRIKPYNSESTGTDIVSKHDRPADVNYLLRGEGASITTTNGFFFTPPVCDLEINKTYHVAMVYNGVALKFYRNGFLMSEVVATGSLITNNYSTRIGNKAGYYPAAEVAQSVINEIRIWNTSRSQTEIRSYMKNSLPSPTTQAGLLAYYYFDNLLNKQGNNTWNGVLLGSASILNTNTSCEFSADSVSCTLPIHYDNFNVTYVSNKYGKIGFTTFSKEKEESIAIERSYDGIEFERIGHAVITQTNATQNQYEFLDYSFQG